MRQPKHVTTTFPLFFLMFAGILLAGFSYEKGNPVSFARFLALFRPEKPKLPCEPLP